tara:strand:- start:50 stop:217 length:168 start_codon:yes stop_codon:yes gene_type:complete
MKYQNNDNLNQHDPFNKHVWADDKKHPAWALVKIIVGGFVAFLFMATIATGGLLL